MFDIDLRAGERLNGVVFPNSDIDIRIDGVTGEITYHKMKVM